MFTPKFSSPNIKQFTYAEQVKILVEQIYTAYINIEYKLPSDASIAQAAINICLYNLCGQDPEQEDDKTINNADEQEIDILNIDQRTSILESNLKSGYPLINLSFQAYINDLHEKHTNYIELCHPDFIMDSFMKYIKDNINYDSIKDFLMTAHKVLELNCPSKIENKKIISEIAEYLCKVIKSKFEISEQVLKNAEIYKQEIEGLLVFLARHSCVHCVGWPNTKKLSEQFLKEAEQAVHDKQFTLYKHKPYI